MVNRKFLWNRVTDPGEQEALPHKYIIVMINEEGNIKEIKQSVLEQMFVGELSNICDFPLPSDTASHCKFHCVAVSFSGDKYLDTRKIYGNPGKIIRDKRLYIRKRGDILSYIEKLTLE